MPDAAGCGLWRSGAGPSEAIGPPGRRTLRRGVLPDVAGFDRDLDYEVPAKFSAEIRPGSIVRVPLQGRAVRGWVVAYPVQPPEGLALRPIAKVTGWAPSPSCSNWPNGPPGGGRAGAARCFLRRRRRAPCGLCLRRPGALLSFGTGLGGARPGAPGPGPRSARAGRGGLEPGHPSVAAAPGLQRR